MGCDIHGYLEVKKNKWEVIEDIPFNRDYDMFGLLADVRNYVNAVPISQPKGLPKDIIDEKLLEEIEDWKWDGHSYSWLNWEEIEKYDRSQIFQDSRISAIDKKTGKRHSKAYYMAGKKHGDEDEYFYYKCLPISAEEIISGSNWNNFFKKMKNLASNYGKKNVRIVFWFDN